MSKLPCPGRPTAAPASPARRGPDWPRSRTAAGPDGVNQAQVKRGVNRAQHRMASTDQSQHSHSTVTAQSQHSHSTVSHTTSDSKPRSASDEHGHQVEHTTRRAVGKGKGKDKAGVGRHRAENGARHMVNKSSPSQEYPCNNHHNHHHNHHHHHTYHHHPNQWSNQAQAKNTRIHTKSTSSIRTLKPSSSSSCNQPTHEPTDQ